MNPETAKKLKTAGMAAAFAAVAAYVIFAVSHFTFAAEQNICRGVKIDITDSSKVKFIEEKDVRNLMDENGYSELRGKSLASINTTKMERMLKKKMSSIKEVDCYKTPDSMICVRISQRHPIVRVKTQARDYYVDTDGETMPVPEHQPAYVPIASGYINEKFATTRLYEFARFLEGDKFWNALIEQIVVENYKEEVILVPRVGPQVVRLGTFDNYEQKLYKLKRLYTQAFNKAGWNHYKEINLKFDKQVVCTRKD